MRYDHDAVIVHEELAAALRQHRPGERDEICSVVLPSGDRVTFKDGSHFPILEARLVSGQFGAMQLVSSVALQCAHEPIAVIQYTLEELRRLIDEERMRGHVRAER